MKSKISFFLALFLGGALLTTGSLSAEEMKQEKSAIHLHTTWSSGPLTAEEVIQNARALDVPILIFTDSALRRWEYTMLPWLGPILHKKVEQPSVIRMGPKHYFNALASLQKKYPDMLILAGTEVAPHYYWTGSYFKNNLTLRDWQKHLLVFGLEKPADFKNLPLTSNPHRRGLRWRTLPWLWPLAILWGARLLLKIQRVRRVEVRGQVWESKERPFRWPAIFLFLVAGGALLVNFPFTDTRYSPLSGFQGAQPYQDLIDYARKKGGLVFWAHPEAPRGNEYDAPVGVETPAYPELLLQTRGYHGFALFFEGYRQVGGIGGVWDQVLMEYVQGKRMEPVWAIGELDYHQEMEPEEKPINEVETVFSIPEMTREAVLGALRSGKMYARWNNPRAVLKFERYELEGPGEKRARSGETLAGAREVVLHCRVECERGGPEKIKLVVIRNGELWKTTEGETPLEVEIPDQPGEKTYYRIGVEGKYPMYLNGNPIFVDPAAR